MEKINIHVSGLWDGLWPRPRIPQTPYAYVIVIEIYSFRREEPEAIMILAMTTANVLVPKRVIS